MPSTYSSWTALQSPQPKTFPFAVRSLPVASRCRVFKPWHKVGSAAGNSPKWGFAPLCDTAWIEPGSCSPCSAPCMPQYGLPLGLTPPPGVSIPALIDVESDMGVPGPRQRALNKPVRSPLIDRALFFRFALVFHPGTHRLRTRPQCLGASRGVGGSPRLRLRHSLLASGTVRLTKRSYR